MLFPRDSNVFRVWELKFKNIFELSVKCLDEFLAFVTAVFVSDKELVLYKILNHYNLNCTSVSALTRTNEESQEASAWTSLTALLDHILSLAMLTFPQWAMVTGEIGSICDQGQ